VVSTVKRQDDSELDYVRDIWSPAVRDNQTVDVESLCLKGWQPDVGKKLWYLSPWGILWMKRQMEEAGGPSLGPSKVLIRRLRQWN
jgi:hypothetical protein